MTSRYINESGCITRRGIRIQDFAVPRLLSIACLIALLIITNPLHINEGPHALFGFTKKSTKKSFASTWLGIDVQINFNSQTNWIGRNRATNYVLFSLSKQARGTGVDLGILMNQFTICTYQGRAPQVCEWIADNACHEMIMFDSRYRPFTALRIVQMVKLVSFTLQKCYNAGTLCPAASGFTAPLASLLSTLHQPILWNRSDFVFLNLFLYPALVLLDRLSTAGTSTNDAASLHFYAVAFILIFIAGGIANIVAVKVTSASAVRGMTGSIASALGYICFAKPRKIIVDWMGIELTSGDVLFLTFAVTATACLFRLEHLFGGSWRMNDSIAWAVGGLLGYTICRLQLEQYNLWWWTY